MTDRRPDAGVQRVLAKLGVDPEAMLGFGGEAWVFASGSDQVIRIHHDRATPASVDRRTALLAELGRSAGQASFEIPEVFATERVEGRILTRERRLAGRPLLAVLGETVGSARADLVRGYLEAADAIGDLGLARDTYGDLTQDNPIEARTFRAYLERRARRSLRAAGPEFSAISARALASEWPEPAAPALVHLDAFPGNMLTEGGRITAVIDFGSVSLAGDRRLDPVGAAAYLTTEITPTATPVDRAIAADWLKERGLAELYEAGRRWLAAYWAWARDDRRLQDWCRSVLL